MVVLGKRRENQPLVVCAAFGIQGSRLPDLGQHESLDPSRLSFQRQPSELFALDFRQLGQRLALRECSPTNLAVGVLSVSRHGAFLS
jgi:hypothetical protein